MRIHADPDPNPQPWLRPEVTWDLSLFSLLYLSVSTKNKAKWPAYNEIGLHFVMCTNIQFNPVVYFLHRSG